MRLLDHPKLVNQLCGLERRTGEGRDTIKLAELYTAEAEQRRLAAEGMRKIGNLKTVASKI